MPLGRTSAFPAALACSAASIPTGATAAGAHWLAVCRCALAVINPCPATLVRRYERLPECASITTSSFPRLFVWQCYLCHLRRRLRSGPLQPPGLHPVVSLVICNSAVEAGSARPCYGGANVVQLPGLAAESHPAPVPPSWCSRPGNYKAAAAGDFCSECPVRCGVGIMLARWCTSDAGPLLLWVLWPFFVP